MVNKYKWKQEEPVNLAAVYVLSSGTSSSICQAADEFCFNFTTLARYYAAQHCYYVNNEAFVPFCHKTIKEIRMTVRNTV